MFKNKVVIFGSDHFNTLGLIRGFGEMGISPYLLLHGCGKNPSVAKSKYIKQCLYARTAEEGIDILLRHFGNESLKPFLFLTNDRVAEVVDSRYDVLRDEFYVQNAGVQNGLMPYLDKYRQCVAAKEWGFAVPKTHLFDRDKVDYHLVEYPCIVKPAKSVNGTKKDIVVCRNEEELRCHVDHLTGSCDRIVVQEYVEKDYEVVIDGVALKREVRIPGMVRKVREHISGSGGTVFAKVVPLPEDLDIQPIVRALKNIGYVGLFSVELARKGDRYFFIEFNFRNDATGYAMTKAGVNLPLLFCMDQLNMENESGMMRTPLYFMAKSDIYYVRRGRLTLRQWLNDYRKTDCFLQHNDVDRRPYGGKGRMLLMAFRAKLLNLMGL